MKVKMQCRYCDFASGFTANTFGETMKLTSWIAAHEKRMHPQPPTRWERFKMATKDWRGTIRRVLK